MTPASHQNPVRRGTSAPDTAPGTAPGSAAPQIGIWLPVYGGWLRTLDISPTASMSACLQTARLADSCGYDFLYCSENLLNPVHGANVPVIDAWTLLSAIAATTTRIDLCGAVKPGFRSPLQVARMVDTVSALAKRPIALSIVCGWWQSEFERAGVDWLDHTGRYDRAEAFLTALHTLFNSGASGLDPAHRPEAWIAGHSARAVQMAAEAGECLFLNGMDDAALAHQIATLRKAEATTGRKATIAINAHVIAEPTNSAAQARVARLIARRDTQSIAEFRTIMQQSGATSWANLSDAEMVDSNAGFAAGLVGDYATLQARLRQLRSLGVDRVLCQFDNPAADIPVFMSRVVDPIRDTSPEPVAAHP